MLGLNRVWAPKLLTPCRPLCSTNLLPNIHTAPSLHKAIAAQLGPVEPSRARHKPIKATHLPRVILILNADKCGDKNPVLRIGAKATAYPEDCASPLG